MLGSPFADGSAGLELLVGYIHGFNFRKGRERDRGRENVKEREGYIV